MTAAKRAAGLRRQAARAEAMRHRLAQARTPEAAMNMAYDWLRSSVLRMSRHTTRTGTCPDRAAAERVMRKVTVYLTETAISIDEGRER